MHYYYIILLISILGSNVNAQNKISIKQQSEINISHKLSIYKPTITEIQPDEVPPDHLFEKNQHALLNIHSNEHTVWAKFTIENQNQYPLPIVIEFRNAGITNIRYFIRHKHLLIYQKEGFQNATARNQKFGNRFPIKQLTLDPNVIYTVYVKISGAKHKLKIPVTVYDQYGFNKKSSIDNLESGLFYGIFITLFLSGLLFLILQFRIREQITYITYLLLSIGFFFMIDGYASEYFFYNNNAVIATVIESFGFLLICVFSLFLKQYFESYLGKTFYTKLLLIQCVTNLFLFAFTITVPFDFIFIEWVTYIAITLLFITTVLIRHKNITLRRNIHDYVYIAITINMLLALIFGILQHYSEISYSNIQILVKSIVLVELVLLTFSFYKRMQIMHFKTQHENITNLRMLNDVVEKQNILLEKKVTERTLRLEQKNQELKRQISHNKQMTKALNEKHVALETANKELEKSFKSSSADHVRLHKALIVNNKQQIALQASIDEISEKNQTLEQQNEEILSQKDKIQEQNHLLEIKNRDITDSIQYAKRIQKSIMPPPSLLKKQFADSFIFLKPKDQLSGDFYWFDTVMVNKSPCHIISAIDCTGHGVPGALMSVIASDSLHDAIHSKLLRDPGKIISHMNEQIIKSLNKKNTPDSLKDGMDLAIISVYPEQKIIQFAGARNPLYYYRKSELEVFTGSIFSVGTISTPEYPVIFETKIIHYDIGDTVYLFSDGFADQFGGHNGNKFRYNHLKKMFNLLVHLPMQKQELKTKEILHKWQGSYEQTDDILIIGIKL